MKCKTCGADGEISKHERKKKAGATYVFKCSKDAKHRYVISKAAGEAESGTPAATVEKREAAPETEPKKNRKSLAGYFFDWLGE